MKLPREVQPVKRNAKDELYLDFFRNAWETMESFELRFGADGVKLQVFGTYDLQQAQKNFRESRPWKTLSDAYEYGVNGVEPEEPEGIAIDAQNVLLHATSDGYKPCDEWDNVVAMCDGRFALQDGSDPDLYKVALLANVDVRTARNAAAAGELDTYKEKLFGRIVVTNSSARKWLAGRRGFRPTSPAHSFGQDNLLDVSNSEEFGAFLVKRRQVLGIGLDENIVAVRHSMVDSSTLKTLEAGKFSLPIDATGPLADFYQVDRGDMVRCVMTVFFPNEFALLAAQSPRT